MLFVILGKPKRGKDALKKDIAKQGGKVVTKINREVMAIFANKEDVEKMGTRMEEAKEQEVHVVPEEFIDEVARHYGKIPEFVLEKSICDWGSDVSISKSWLVEN